MINRRYRSNYIVFSIAAVVVSCLFAGWGVAEKTFQAGASYTDKAELEILKQDLNKIDGLSSQGLYAEASVIVGQDIRARDIYGRYIKKAAGISEELLNVKKKLNAQGDTVTLQELGAICQKVSMTNTRFKDTFQHGEEQFQTYQLIQKAIHNLEASISYWRISNKYRKVYRGGARERMEDDEVLKVHMITAMNAIEELQTIMETRDALSKNLEEDW